MVPKPLRDFYFSIDERSLGLFRIAIGLILIADLLMRWPDLAAFYTPSGVLPPETAAARVGGRFHFSVFDTVTSTLTGHLLFAVTFSCYAMLLVGWRTTLAKILSLVFYVSLVNRNVMLRNGGHMVLSTMLVWTLFLPVGRRFGVDAWISSRRLTDKRSQSSTNVRSLASLAAVFQIAVIYLLTALTKRGDTWTQGTAIYYALQIDHWTAPLGRWLASQPLWVTKPLTWWTLVVEFAAAPLILLPLYQPYLRRAAIVLLTLLQLGISLTMTIWTFPFIMIGLNALILSKRDWEGLTVMGAFLLAGMRRRVALLKSSILADASLRPALAFGGARISRAALSKHLVTDGSPSARGTTGAKRTSQKTIAEPSQRAVLAFALREGLVALILTAVLIDNWNNHFGKICRVCVPTFFQAIIQYPQIGQKWDMFAPDPMRVDGWWVVDGMTESGRRLDPLTGREPSFVRPVEIGRDYSRCWNDYLFRLSWNKYKNYRSYFARYLTRTNHRISPIGDRLARFDMYYVTQASEPPDRRTVDRSSQPVVKTKVWHHECFNHPAPVTTSASGPNKADP